MSGAFLWGLFAASSLVIGAPVVRLRAPGERLLGVIMAFGAGVLISAVAFELIEEAVGISGGSGGTAAGFFVGAAVFTVGDIAIPGGATAIARTSTARRTMRHRWRSCSALSSMVCPSRPSA